jgi:hypothetical protein
MIGELQAERDRLDQAIVALERLMRRNQPRRGRPPAWLKRQAGEDAEEVTDAHARQRGATAGQS